MQFWEQKIYFKKEAFAPRNALHLELEKCKDQRFTVLSAENKTLKALKIDCVNRPLTINDGIIKLQNQGCSSLTVSLDRFLYLSCFSHWFENSETQLENDVTYLKYDDFFLS